MLVSVAITRINYLLRGTDEDAPSESTEEWTYWVSLINGKKSELYNDPKNWNAIYEVKNVGTITASATPSFNLDTDFIAPAGTPYVIKTDDNRHNLELIKPEERSTLTQATFIAGNNPKVLYFANEIEATNQIVGGELYLPSYAMPADVTANSDTMPFDEPEWACAAVAAEIAFGDITYEDRAEGLNAKANYLYSLMTKKNRKGTHKNPRVTPTTVKRIRGY